MLRIFCIMYAQHAKSAFSHFGDHMDFKLVFAREETNVAVHYQRIEHERVKEVLDILFACCCVF